MTRISRVGISQCLQLVEAGETGSMVGVRMVGVRSGRDWTDPMRNYSSDRVAELATAGLAGFVLKSNSPSCGLVGVDIGGEQGKATRVGVGLFAAALGERLPDLPAEEEGRLMNPTVREDFINRVYAYWRRLGQGTAQP